MSALTDMIQKTNIDRAQKLIDDKQGDIPNVEFKNPGKPVGELKIDKPQTPIVFQKKSADLIGILYAVNSIIDRIGKRFV